MQASLGHERAVSLLAVWEIEPNRISTVRFLCSCEKMFPREFRGAFQVLRIFSNFFFFHETYICFDSSCYQFQHTGRLVSLISSLHPPKLELWFVMNENSNLSLAFEILQLQRLSLFQ